MSAILQLKSNDFQRSKSFFMCLIVLISLSGCGVSHMAARDYDRTTRVSSQPIMHQETNKGTAIHKPEMSTVSSESESRILHHHGDITLLVTNTRQIIKTIMDLVHTKNGYIERISQDAIVVQIPAKEFDVSFNEILALGKVLNKKVTTEDITAEYRSVKLRLDITLSTRDRLIVLLRDSENEEQKMELLKQLEQVNARIQHLESMFTLLKTKVAYSKISIRLQSYARFNQNETGFEPNGMRWINELSPYKDQVALRGESIKFHIPENMLRVKKYLPYWSAESGDRVAFKAYQRANRPEGDTTFWIKSIKHRLVSKYKSVTTVVVGKFSLLRLVTYDNEPSVYYVGVNAKEDDVDMLELFFPSTSLEDKYKKTIYASITRGIL